MIRLGHGLRGFAEQETGQVDHVLVLEAPRGAGKSSAVRRLAVHSEWFTDHVPDLHSKDAALQLCGRWIIETVSPQQVLAGVTGTNGSANYGLVYALVRSQ